MNCFYALRPVIAILLAAGNLTLPVRASAAERPYSSRGTAQFVTPNDFVGTGQATHLGRYTEVGNVQFSPTANPTILQFDGWAIYTAAKGDHLYANLSGQLNALTGEITATVTYDGGTGRFEDANGSATLAGQMLPNGTVTVTVKGTIDY